MQEATATAREITPEVTYRAVDYIEPKDIIDIVNTAFSGGFIKARDMSRALMYEYGVSDTEILRAIQRQTMSGAINVPDEAKVEIAKTAADIDYKLAEGLDE